MKTRLQHWLVSLALVSSFAASVCLPTAALAATTPQRPVCSAGLQYAISSYNRSVQHTTETAVGDNDTGKAQNYEFTSQHARTRSFSVDVSFNVEAGVIFEQVSVTVGIQVQFSFTDTIGVNAWVNNVPSGKSAIGNYGVFGVATSGDYYYLTGDCRKSPDYGTVDAWSPYGSGWETKIISG